MILALAVLALSSDSYVSSTGNDANDGTSPETAWRTFARANARTFKRGETLYIESGKTFSGPLSFDKDDVVSVLNYGEGRPLIDGAAGDGIVLDRCESASIRNVAVVGAGRKTGNKQGVGVRITGAKNVRLEGIEASGFQRAGVEFRGCTGITLRQVHAHDNGYAGISSESPRSRNVRIEQCRAIDNAGDPTILDNHSGSGIVLFDVEDAIVTHCEAAGNGAEMPRKGNGPVGIWCANRSTRVTIQHCISHHNKSPGADGGGFDFDGGVTDSVMQFNYSYENKGWGYLLYEYGSDSPFANNVVRYCVSENDGDAGIGIGEQAKHGFSDCRIHNNVVVNDRGKPGVHFFQGTPKNFSFHNNLFLTKGAPQVKNAAKGRFIANGYQSIGGGFSVDEFTDFEKWRKETGQETLGGRLYGLNADPGLTGPFAGKLTDPARLKFLDAYKLRAGSPARESGMNLQSMVGIDPGKEDFFGTRLPVGPGHAMGIQEFGR